MFNKKGLSNMIGYVLLIVMVIFLSSMVYGWLKFYSTSGEISSCPEGANLVIEKYRCIPGDGITVEFENRGLFSIDGFKLRAHNRSGADFGVYVLDEVGASLDPGENYSKFYDFSDLNVNPEGIDNLTFIDVQPFLTGGDNNVSCVFSYSAEVVTCYEEGAGGGGGGGSDPCEGNNGADCDDGNVCTINDVCSGGGCFGEEVLSDCSDLIAWWRFEGDLTDETGNYDGSSHGDVGFVDIGFGDLGQAATFDGRGDYVSIPELNLSEDMQWTIFYFFYMDSEWSISMGDITEHENKIYHGRFNDVCLYNDEDQKYGEYDFIDTSGSWHSIAFVMDSSNRLFAYIDGFLDDQEHSRSSSELIINAIGDGRNSPAGRGWDGELDEIMIFSRELSSSEIIDLHNSFSS